MPPIRRPRRVHPQIRRNPPPHLPIARSREWIS
jgi:hypothetical protein